MLFDFFSTKVMTIEVSAFFFFFFLCAFSPDGGSVCFVSFLSLD